MDTHMRVKNEPEDLAFKIQNLEFSKGVLWTKFPKDD